ncbi:MAG: cob(I)yrinic acid a,c-diamide adenosyltransferase [Deltaproteobacteria bacterium]|nr:cob(I)yrinic acid a,c-diamide adenosyltransferase [Deltaproteobacteria bacterium]
MGLAIRAAGAGLKVNFVQFMKSGTSGEAFIFADIGNIRYQCPGKHPFIRSAGPETIHYDHAAKAFDYAIEAIANEAQLLICDEILNTLIFGLLKKEKIIQLMDMCRGKTELVMTGASTPADIIEQSDYSTEFRQIKHPYYSGTMARRGIEF